MNSVLSATDDGIIWRKIGGPSFAYAPDFDYDARVINGYNATTGLANAQPVDGSNILTWRNVGTAGAAGDLAQGTAGARPFFRATATSGKIKNCPAVEGDGARWMQSSTFAVDSQPYMTATVLRMTDLAATYYIYTGAVAGAETELVVNFGGAGKLQLNNGGGFVDTAQTIVATTWAILIHVYNGASSYQRKDGGQSANLQTNAVHFTGITLLGGTAGTGFNAKAMITRHLRWVQTANKPLPDPKDVETVLVDAYGITPQ